MVIGTDTRGRMMKRMRNDPRLEVICVIVFVLLLVFQLDLFSSSNPANQTRHPRNSTVIEEPTRAGPEESRSPKDAQSSTASAVISCDRSHRNYDLCKINVPTVFDPTQSTFYDRDSTDENATVLIEERVRPYPRKWENFTMAQIKEVTFTSGPLTPPCIIRHRAPALVFSAGGYNGNFFHDFNDNLIPLFITVHSIFRDRNFVLVVSDLQDWWLTKYADLLNSISMHPIIDVANDVMTHCFPWAASGLISHGFMTIDPQQMSNSVVNLKYFHNHLGTAFGRKNSSISKPPPGKPRLVLASRSGSVGRVIVNQDKVKLAAEEVGFEVVVFEPTTTTPLHESYALLNSSHILIGVHGAALTHSLFLRPGALFMQIIPIGADGVSDFCFRQVAKDLELHYMEYKIGIEESTLKEKYGEDEMVLKNPTALQEKGWSKEVMDIYLKEQNVKLDLHRFRGYLKEAYELAKTFME